MSAFMDFMLLKKPIDKLGVDKNALFSDPQQYLTNQPITFKRVRPWLMMVFLLILMPVLPIVIGEVLIKYDWTMTSIICGCIAALVAIPALIIDTKEELHVTAQGISISLNGKTVVAPWSLFNKHGQSDLSAGIEVKMPINTQFINDVVMTDKQGTETRGNAIKAPHFRWDFKKEMVGLRNFWPMGAADFAEMIRRIALTLGHQDDQPAFSPNVDPKD